MGEDRVPRCRQTIVAVSKNEPGRGLVGCRPMSPVPRPSHIERLALGDGLGIARTTRSPSPVENPSLGGRFGRIPNGRKVSGPLQVTTQRPDRPVPRPIDPFDGLRASRLRTVHAAGRGRGEYLCRGPYARFRQGPRPLIAVAFQSPGRFLAPIGKDFWGVWPHSCIARRPARRDLSRREIGPRPSGRRRPRIDCCRGPPSSRSPVVGRVAGGGSAAGSGAPGSGAMPLLLGSRRGDRLGGRAMGDSGPWRAGPAGLARW